MSQSYKHLKTSVSLIHFHFVWIPRRRREVLVGEVAERLSQLLRDSAGRIDCHIMALDIMPDHIHLFLNCPPSLAPDQIMPRVKGYSSRILRKEYPHLKRMPSMWTRSYFVSTAGHVSREAIKRYIENQKTT